MFIKLFLLKNILLLLLHLINKNKNKIILLNNYQTNKNDIFYGTD